MGRIGQSSLLQPGEDVLAIGSPHGLQDTVTQGIVSAMDRLQRQRNAEWGRYIQFDAPGFPGNSGELLLFFFYFLFFFIFILFYLSIYYPFINLLIHIYLYIHIQADRW